MLATGAGGVVGSLVGVVVTDLVTVAEDFAAGSLLPPQPATKPMQRAAMSSKTWAFISNVLRGSRATTIGAES
ncbi:MAG: hypothetical protein ACR2FG_13995, partial [Marmoricola sp.]